MNLDKLDSPILINVNNIAVKCKTIRIKRFLKLKKNILELGNATQVKALVWSRWGMIFFLTLINISSKVFKNEVNH